MKRRLLLNTASNYIVFVMQVVVAFIMTPLYVRYMGLRDYGLWEVVVSIIGYAGMLDLGLWPTISRFVAKYEAERDRQRQEETFATSLVFLSAIGVVGSLLTLGVVVLLERDLFFGGGPDTAYYRLFLLVLSINVVLKFPGIVAEAYLEGQQRYFLKNMFTIANLAISTSIVYALIDQVRGLLLLVSVGVIATTIKYSIFFALLFRSQPQEFSFRFSAWSTGHLRTLLRFGLKSFVQGLSGRITNQSSPLIIAGVANTALVPLFTIPASLVRYATTFLMTSTHAFMPLFTAMSSAGQDERIRKIYLVANKAVVGVGSLMLLGVALVGPSFVSVWISPEVAAQSGPILAFLAIGALGLGFNPFGSRYLTAIDQHGIYARYSPVFAILGIALGFVFMVWLGLPGLAAGTAAPVLISLPVFVAAVCRHLDISLRRYVLSFMPVTLLAAAAATGSWLWQQAALGAPTDYLGVIRSAVSMSAVYGIVFVIGDLMGERRESVVRVFLGRGRQSISAAAPDGS